MRLLFLLLILSFQSRAEGLIRFIPEMGEYVYSRDFVMEDLARSHPELSLNRNFDLPDLPYRLVEGRNEYQIKNWYSHDWFKLQDAFLLDVERFNQIYGAATFNQAKINQYKKFPFDRGSMLHQKKVRALREWGGLTHPPLKKLTLPLNKYHHRYRPLTYSQVKSPYFNPSFQTELDRVSHSGLSFGNKVRAFADRESFAWKKKLIKSAKESILISSLAFICDGSTNEIVNLLIQKHREGIHIKVLVDGTINRTAGSFACPKRMRAAGIEVIATGDFFKNNAKAINHVKMIIVDMKVAMAGGQNMLDADHRSRGTDFSNRDVDLYAQGPLVSDMAQTFLENWQHHFVIKQKKNDKYPMTSGVALYQKLQELRALEFKQGRRGAARYAALLNSNQRMNGVCRFIGQTPYKNPKVIGETYLKLLDKVQSYLVITDPIKSDTHYKDKSHIPLIEKRDSFEMFNLLHDKVQSVMKRGIELDYLTTNIDMAGNEFVAITNEEIRGQMKAGKIMNANLNYKKIQWFNHFFGKPHYQNLINDYLPYRNTRVWTHISFMHSKIFYFDRILASIGSYNFHHNATDHAYESTTICMDETLNQDLDRILVQDMANSIPLVFSRLID